jgi:hypothetical protein
MLLHKIILTNSPDILGAGKNPACNRKFGPSKKRPGGPQKFGPPQLGDHFLLQKWPGATPLPNPTLHDRQRINVNSMKKLLLSSCAPRHYHHKNAVLTHIISDRATYHRQLISGKSTICISSSTVLQLINMNIAMHMGYRQALLLVSTLTLDRARVGVKPGLWTMDWTMDSNLDWNLDSNWLLSCVVIREP